VSPKAGKATLQDLAKILLDDYRINGRRSAERVEDALGHLRRFFAATAASQIGADLISRYVGSRREEGAAPATINRELGALKRSKLSTHGRIARGSNAAAQKKEAFERSTGQTVRWLFHRDGKPIKDFRIAWGLASQRAAVTGKVPDHFRRTAVRNLERAGVSRSATMAIVGHRSESIYRGVPTADDTILKRSAAKLAAFYQSEKTHSD
jgi:hypothetical protein